jgi:hypothetical protein
MIVRREDFGPVSELRPTNHKKVWFICNICGCGVLRQYNIYMKSEKRCLSCKSKIINKINRDKNSIAQKKRWSKIDHAVIGKKISESKIGKKQNLDLSIFKNVGYEVIRVHDKRIVEFKCPNNHIYKIKYSNFKKGKRCNLCNRIDYTKAKLEFEKRGFKLLSENIKNTRTPIYYECPNEHIGNITYDNFANKGHGCSQCAGNAKIKISKENVIDILGKSYIIEYNKDIIERNDVIKLICDKNHESIVTLAHILSGRRCKTCGDNKDFYEERKIANFITSLGINIETNNRSLIHPEELDIFIPSHNIAIEYNGLYWHSEALGKDRYYHSRKFEKCNSVGIRLIQIFEDEWTYKEDIVKNRIKHILNIVDGKIYARQCKIEIIDSKTSSEFCEKYHIQGYSKSAIKLGAFYNDKLVSVMTFSKLSIAKGQKNKDGIWELNRFCSSVPVIGIASKLISYFKKHYNWKEIISYADRRWNTGNLYKKLGFKLISITKPNYWYTMNKKRHHRFKFRRNKLEGDGTELEIMQKNGYNRIWDCGSFKFKLTNY